ncbi:rhodanese-like domain-containing protein [Bermanella sp. R86510]|uniref:rhodanese-like domain-containing protein n=1 Tax=unclassified Bermanella TaxID=2627862 RepID=UPI0037C8DF29
MRTLLALLIMLTSASMAYAQQAVLLDVRTAEEFNQEHAYSAILIPHDEIADKAPTTLTDKDQPIKVYCRSGNRAGKAVKSLKALGYSNVENIGTLDDAKQFIKR